MEYLPYITAGLGGINLLQFGLQVRTWKSQEKKEEAIAQKEKALAQIEEGNALGKSADIFERLTAIVDREVERFDKRMKEQEVLIGQQQEEIKMLRTLLSEYKQKCDLCAKK